MNEGQGMELNITINDASCCSLVDNGDIQLFADSVCRLIKDIELRNYFPEILLNEPNNSILI